MEAPWRSGPFPASHGRQILSGDARKNAAPSAGHRRDPRPRAPVRRCRRCPAAGLCSCPRPQASIAVRSVLGNKSDPSLSHHAGPAMPALNPAFSDIVELLVAVPEGDEAAVAAVRAREGLLTKPAGSLG